MEKATRYDIDVMKKAAAEGRKALQDIRQEICNAGLEGSVCRQDIERLEGTCRGYEILIGQMEAAVKIYSSAQAAAAEIADWR